MKTTLDKDLLDKVEAAIHQLRPFLQADGGDVELVGIDENFVASVRLLGACQSCNISHMTMKAGIEDAVKRAVPQIHSVIEVQA